MRTHFSDPANLGPFSELQFFGSPRTIRRQIERYLEVGFNKFIVTVNTPHIPQRLRHEWLGRFAREVAPEFSRSFGKSRAAA